MVVTRQWNGYISVKVAFLDGTPEVLGKYMYIYPDFFIKFWCLVTIGLEVSTWYATVLQVCQVVRVELVIKMLMPSTFR